jgi:hypothetical protein
MTNYQTRFFRLSWMLLSTLFFFFSCEKEAILTDATEVDRTTVSFRSAPTSLYAVTEYQPGQPSMIYEIDRLTHLPTGIRTNVYYHGMIVDDVIGICRMVNMHFNGGNPFYAVTLGPNSNVQQSPSVVFGITNIQSGEIEFEMIDNDTDIALGRHIKDLEWSDWGELRLIGIENTPRANGYHYLIDFKETRPANEWQILNVPATEEVRGLSWVDFGYSPSFNCSPNNLPLHFFDTYNYTQGGTLPVPISGFYTLFMTTMDVSQQAHLYTLILSSNHTIEAQYIQQLNALAPQSEMALGWDHADNYMYVGGNQIEEYNFEKMGTCPSDPWILGNTSGYHNWNASIADFTSQPFKF